jgi:hypothetical protein
MEFNVTTASRLYRQPARPILLSRAKTPPSRSRVLLAVALLLAMGCGTGVAQSPSGGQEWPQSHQDEPYSADQEQPYGDSAPPARQPLDPGQLEQLVAPIALYPDALVAQVLAASTYPQQVAEADRWRQAQGYRTPDQIASGADAEDWDPSVKALTAFPQVLAQMDRNLEWTSDLGNAYYNQPQDVLEAVQVMRHRAQAAGTLRSTPQEAVRYDEGNIVLAPPDPQLVYVPTYNPWTVYGAPVSPYPGFSLWGAMADVAGLLPLRYGLGIAMSAFTQPWGWLAWGLDWLGHALLFNHADYYSHSGSVADWGFPHRGFYAYRGREGLGHGSNYARLGGGDQRRRAGFNPGGWHGFSRSPERPIEAAGDRSSRGFRSSQGFESSRSLRSGRDFQSLPNQHYGFARPMERTPENRGTYRPEFNRGTTGWSRGESYRASAGNFQRNQWGQSGSLSRSSGKSRAGGLRPFGGGHSHDTLASIGRSRTDFGGGHVPKGFGSSHGFGGSKSFGGGHWHGGGGGHAHGGGHGGGKHHR